jgi:predicted permease
LSLALLASAGLLIKSMQRIFESDRGFDPHGVITMVLKAPRQRYTDRNSLERLSTTILERVANVPGVESACLSNNLPGISTGWQNDVWPEGHPPIKPGEMINVDWSIVTAGYFKTMGISIVQGRAFTREEVDEGRPVVLVDEGLAKRFWPEGDAVGKHLKYDSPVWHEIIGVVRRVNIYGSATTPLIRIYTPFGRAPQLNASLSVRTDLPEPMGTGNAIIQEVHSIDRDVAVSGVARIDDLLAREVSTKKVNTILFGSFAALALILAAAGVYGVMSYAVSQRTQEIGLRMAVGAQTRDVVLLFLGHGLKLICGGIGVGLLVALAMTRLIASLLFGVSPTDPATFLVAAFSLAIAALSACYLPARRATRVDPVDALRCD